MTLKTWFAGTGKVNWLCLAQQGYKSEARNKKFETIPNVPNSNAQNCSYE
jgi:hypothetical protein